MVKQLTDKNIETLSIGRLEVDLLSKDSTEKLSNILKENDVVVDIGANIGVLGIRLSKSLKSISMKGRRLKSPPIKDLAVATKQLSSMIRTGLPLLESLKIRPF